MFGTIRKVIIAGAVLATTSAAAQAVTVKFDQPNMGFGQGPIVVESTDGKKWSKIKSGKLKMPVSIFIGHNSNDYRMNYLRIHQSGELLYDKLINTYEYRNPWAQQFTITGSTDNFDSIAKTLLLEACNSRLSKSGAIHEDQKLYFKVPLQLYAKFFRDNGTWFSKTSMGHSMVPVVCKAFPKRVPPKPPQISNVRFQVYAENRPGCPRYRYVRLRLEGDKVGTADVIVMRDDGKKIEAKVPVTLPGEHQFFSLESTRVKKSETRKYYLVVKGTKISVGWKTVAIKCPSGAGDDEIASPTKPEQAKPKPNRPVIVVRPVKPTKPVRPVVDLTTPKLQCIGGKVKLNTCYCKANYKKVKVAKHTYRCVKLTTNKVPNRAKPNKKRRKVVKQNRQKTNTQVLKVSKTVR